MFEKYNSPALVKVRPHGHCGFSLVELLVVMTIIAILIALLLPGLSAARGSARNVECLTRFKFFGIASVQYRMDHKDWYPSVHLYVSNPRFGDKPLDHGDFIEELGPYVMPGLVSYSNDWYYGLNRRYTAKVNKFLCPGTPFQGFPGGWQSFAWIGASLSRVYNYQPSCRFGFGDTDTQTSTWLRKRQLASNPSKVILHGETRGTDPSWGYLWWDNNYDRYPIYPHPGKTSNVGLADGHAESVGNASNFRVRVASGHIAWW